MGSMTGRPTHVIVGASLAGTAAAGALRREGFDGRVVLVGDEPDPPYERPPLSKEYLRGEKPAEDLRLREEGWWDENDVELRLSTRVVRLDPAAREVELSDGERLGYDRLLLATGARNRPLSMPGGGLAGVFQLRTLEDADRLREASRAGARAVVVGAGFIGMEVAASLRSLGLDVTVVEVFEAPLVRAIGAEMGRVLEAIHRDRGVAFRFGEGVERLEGDGRVGRVVTTGGEAIDADLVVAGVGVRPNAELAEDAGLPVDNGILVNERLETNVPGVFAAGDVANHEHPVFGRRIRVEHFDNASRMGAAAAGNMLGRGASFDDAHWFWSDQYEHTIDHAGFAPEWDQVVVRGSVEERDFVAFYLKDGLLRAAFGVDRGRDVRRARDLIRAGRPVDPERLRDPEVDLKKLASDLAANA